MTVTTEIRALCEREMKSICDVQKKRYASYNQADNAYAHVNAIVEWNKANQLPSLSSKPTADEQAALKTALNARQSAHVQIAYVFGNASANRQKIDPDKGSKADKIAEAVRMEFCKTA